ncbi:glycoside hydrolase family 3 N-terminal domain-containing protein [Anditalea andensis]|uniref:Glycosyl hydrolase family 3 n=1 Tax=Anditalea andensis TaxID=1048983 RepID=A0A074L024_9BACT|nr:glycoside hydrolase family 3 N-terminal domain-containing protein [Anditalea andensis]KEO75581.1 glycosyl hydrolase family 3 [Anditalea andensis]
MILKYTFIGLVFLIGLFTNAAGQQTGLPYQDKTLDTDTRINDLIGRMTLEEKVGQLSTLLGWEMYDNSGDLATYSEVLEKAVRERHIGSLWATLRADPWTQKTLANGLDPEQAAHATNAIQEFVINHTRLGIPLILAEEAPHGHMAIGATVFPTSIGQSSTWNPELIREMAKVIAKETRLQGGHIGYGPVLDLAREPRWSRVEETYGEDPYLNSRMGIAMVTGFQGSDLMSGENVASTLKHFAAYGVPEGGHNGFGLSVGLRELHQSYFPPFRAAILAGAKSIMTSYNSIDGIPSTANPYLFRKVLREDWGFKGFVVSDLGSISGLRGSHRVAGSGEEAASLAIRAGVDADLGGNGFDRNLIAAVKKGWVGSAMLDEAVANVLRLKFEMGLFENPFVDPEKAKREVRKPEHVQLARQVAQASITLLKNEGNLLPLNKDIRKVAVIGPNAHNIYNQLGDYTAPQPESNVVTVLEGLQQKLGVDRVEYVKGVAIRDTTEQDIEAAVAAARAAEVAVVVLGGSSARDFSIQHEDTGAARVSQSENEIVSDMESGEGYDRMSLDLMGHQLKLLQAIQATGTPVVLVLIKGRPLLLNWPAGHIPSILEAWYPGQEGGNAIADVLFGDYNPAGRLPVSVPLSVGQLPVYYNYKVPSKHDYVEASAEPLYAFGHGLSYTTFDYQDLQVEVKGNAQDPAVSVQFTVTNSGQMEGDEVVQLYIRDLVSSTVSPVKQLVRFERASIPVGESKIFSFILGKEDLQLMDMEMNWVVEPGDFELMVGASSRDIRLKEKFELR